MVIMKSASGVLSGISVKRLTLMVSVSLFNESKPFKLNIAQTYIQLFVLTVEMLINNQLLMIHKRKLTTLINLGKF